jgi:pimeloyl-ACP methyl ester carboxylesterase
MRTNLKFIRFDSVLKNSLYILFLVLQVSCMDFYMDEKEMSRAFENEQIMPISQTMTIGENHIHYVYTDQHKDQLLIFVHGSPGSWSAFADYFKNDSLLNSFDVLSVDRPGYGGSDGGRPEVSLEKQAFLISEVIRDFGHKNKILIGHSLGGPVVARIAMDDPALASAMIMLAPSIDPAMERYEWYRTWIRSKVGGMVTPTDFWVSNEEILALPTELTLILPLWSQIKIPTIVIQGTKDQFVPKENAAFAQKMLGDFVEVRYLQDVNHFIPWSHPSEVVGAAFSFNSSPVQ